MPEFAMFVGTISFLVKVANWSRGGGGGGGGGVGGLLLGILGRGVRHIVRVAFSLVSFQLLVKLELLIAFAHCKCRAGT